MSSASTSKGRFTVRKRTKPAPKSLITTRRNKSIHDLKLAVLATGGLVAAIPITGGVSFFAAIPAALKSLVLAGEVISPDENIWY